MDSARFDSLARSLGTAASRRRALIAVLGGSLGVLGWDGMDDISAHNLKAKCKKKSGDAKKKCVKKAKKHNAAHASQTAAAPPPPPTCGTGGTCRVFVTSTTHQGNFGGLIVADAICQQRAQAANLPGTYKAWLSDSTNSPNTRFVKSPGPYHLVDGTKVADNYADLTDNSPDAVLDAAIDRTEFGQAVSAPNECWTFTDSDGTDFGGTARCGNWTSTSGDGHYGSVISTSHNWTSFNVHPCSNDSHLYCFQQS